MQSDPVVTRDPSHGQLYQIRVNLKAMMHFHELPYVQLCFLFAIVLI